MNYGKSLPFSPDLNFDFDGLHFYKTSKHSQFDDFDR